MEALKERIRLEGKNLGRGILKIDSFLNHQLDAELMYAVGEELAARCASMKPDRILTAEVSGIVPAMTTARAMGNIPVVYARKHKPITMQEPVFVDAAPSHTKGGQVMLMVSPEFLHAGERVLVVDDFLASGLTIDALGRIVKNSGAELVGFAVVVEKLFEGGRDVLAHWNVPVEACVTITDMSGETVVMV